MNRLNSIEAKIMLFLEEGDATEKDIQDIEHIIGQIEDGIRQSSVHMQDANGTRTEKLSGLLLMEMNRCEELRKDIIDLRKQLEGNDNDKDISGTRGGD